MTSISDYLDERFPVHVKVMDMHSMYNAIRAYDYIAIHINDRHYTLFPIELMYPHAIIHWQ